MLYGFLATWLALAPASTPASPGSGPAPTPAGVALGPAPKATGAAGGPAGAPATAQATAVIPFRIDAQPRVDGVFGDAAALRQSVDRFLGLQTDMERVRDDFSNAVHETLTALASNGDAATAGKAPPSKPCPAATGEPYARALAAGAKYLLLGQQLQGRYRDIRRADDFGDGAALTPDYRVKIKRARDLYQHLLDDYREMRVAFYDQLGAEMHHAGCKTTGPHAPGGVPADGGATPAPNPSDPGAWTMDEPVAADEGPAPVGPPAPRPSSGDVVAPPVGVAMAAPAIWIDVDNTLCAQPTRVTVDGQALGEVGARKKTSVRTHAGPREICALPTSDARACGDPGTIRKAYLHEGWSLTVHCDR
jgi:hypothetical protein